ncbi:MAG TPA: CarD family transcriptional regulator [Thermoclostridium caenicola]|uniref:CarD family transcriptional regulator n=1 Tax=Thermoclostridium caenicola TaxID=659425 RepID=UPI002C8E5CBF|nr:CarD family transcriptional regulator [Thermoclostridium caenicola]HPO77991.1 CarD family transcriptional regulator [Thermoclostridium caenicola]
MFQIDDCVIYNAMGVYKVVDIRREQDISGSETQYYILKPVYGNNLTIKTPVDNNKTLMRKVLSKEEVLSPIESMHEQETIWIDNDRQRKEMFKAVLKTGDSRNWVKLIKTIHMKEQEKKAIGKKLTKADEEIMKIAEKNLYEEFAVALSIPPEEVSSYIMELVS